MWTSTARKPLAEPSRAPSDKPTRIGVPDGRYFRSVIVAPSRVPSLPLNPTASSSIASSAACIAKASRSSAGDSRHSLSRMAFAGFPRASARSRHCQGHRRLGQGEAATDRRSHVISLRPGWIHFRMRCLLGESPEARFRHRFFLVDKPRYRLSACERRLTHDPQ